MHSTHTAEIPIRGVPHAARTAHVFPDLHSSLLAVAPLCDQGCQVTFDKQQCTITTPDGTIITCPRQNNGLWTLPPHVLHETHCCSQQADNDPHREAAPAINRHTNTPADLVAFAHAALFSPAITTLKQALHKGFLPPFTGLTETTLQRFPPSLEATAMGHLDAHRKNTRSTKHTPRRDDPNINECYFPTQPEDTTRTNACFLATTEPRHIVYTDQTGRLPQPSSQGHNYLMVAYDYDSNNILLRPLKSRASMHLSEAIADIHKTLANGGCKPHFIDSTTSAHRNSNNGSNNTISNTNLHPHMSTKAMQQNAPYAQQRIILPQDGGPWTPTFPCICGIRQYRRPNSH